jgi:hypothetical protein
MKYAFLIVGILLAGCTTQKIQVNTIQLPEGSRILQKYDHFTVLANPYGTNPLFLDCTWNPTAVGYAEDAQCLKSL